MKPLRTMIVGVGKRGNVFVKAVKDHPLFEPVAYVDVNAESIRAAVEVSPVPTERCYSDLGAALGQADCDVVFVISPPDLHASHCHAALDHGRHVLVEKPFTKVLAQARAIVEKAECKGLKLVVTQNARYAPIMQKAQELIASGAYGRVCSGLVLKSGYRGGVLHSGKDDHAYLWERGVHDFDTLLHLVHPCRAVRACARSFNPPFSPYKGGASACGWIEFDNGAVFSLYVTFMAHTRRNEYVVECEKASLLIGNNITVCRAAGEDETVTVDPAQYKDGVQRILDGFHDFVTRGVEPPVSGRNNLKTVALVEALGQSSDERQTIELTS